MERVEYPWRPSADVVTFNVIWGCDLLKRIKKRPLKTIFTSNKVDYVLKSVTLSPSIHRLVTRRTGITRQRPLAKKPKTRSIAKGLITCRGTAMSDLFELKNKKKTVMRATLFNTILGQCCVSSALTLLIIGCGGGAI